MKGRIRDVCLATLIGTVGAGTAWAYAEQQPQPQQQQQSQQQQQKQQPNEQNPAATVRLSQVEDEPQQYIGRRITVRGEVGDVLGPRVFKIDESNWADLDGEILVVMDAPFAALVKEEDPITVTGTLKNFVDVRLDREWGWLDLDPEVEARIKSRPVLVATSLVGSDPDLGMFVAVQPAPPAGQSGQSGQAEATGTSGMAGKTGASARTAGDRREP